MKMHHPPDSKKRANLGWKNQFPEPQPTLSDEGSYDFYGSQTLEGLFICFGGK
jgi:hypothetical protein